MIVFMLYSKVKFGGYFKKQISFSVVVIGSLLTLAIQSFVLTHLPFVDCLPYKKGNNILNEMKVALSLSVPIHVEIGIGKNWLEAH